MQASHLGRTAGVLAAASGLLWFGIAVAWVSGDFTIFPDSSGYEASQGFPVSFVGDAWRAWPTPLLFSLTPDYRVQSLLQTLLYAAGWTAIIWVYLWRKIWWNAALSSAALVGLALTPLYLQWTLTILSEATTLGLVLLGVAAAQATADRFPARRRPQLSVWVLGCASVALLGLAAINRVTLVMPMIAIGATLVILGWRHKARTVSGVLAVLLVVTLGYTVWLNGRIDEHWGVSRSATYYGYLTASETDLQTILADPLFDYMTAIGPSCLAGLRASAGGVAAPDPYQVRGVLSTECSEGVAWLEEHFQPEYLKFVATHPTYTARFLLHYLPQVGDTGGYGAITSVLPVSVANLYSSSTDGAHAYRPIYLWLAVWLGSAVVMTRMLMRRRISATQALVPLATSTAGVASLILTVLTLNSEVVRIASQSTALLISSTILILAAMGDSLSQRSSVIR